MAVGEFDPAVLLMPLETPILKVSRPVAACSRCRSAKIKCDGKLPACSSCEKNGRAAECTSTNDQFARGKERSYVSTLETRIDRLQAKLEEARARKPSVVSISGDDDRTMTAVPSRRTSYREIETPTPTPAPTPNTSKALRRKEAATIDDLVSDFGFLSVHATARDFYGFTSAMSYARLILSACSKDPLPDGLTKPLGPRHQAMILIQHYLDNVFVLLPVFDEASFYASVDAVFTRTPRLANALDHFFVRIVLAIASASLSEQRGDQHYVDAIGHICAALEHSEAVLHPGSISSIQAMILLTQYAMLDPHHFDSWSLIGAASRAMVDLGIHQDPPKGTPMLKSKLEMRRRVFYCMYALDRSTSLVQTRAFSFSDDSTKVKIPFTRSPSTSASNSPEGGQTPSQNLWLQTHDQALDLINLRKLQSVWYTELFQSGRSRWEEPYPYLWDTCDSMRKWFDALPSSMSPNMRAFFELELLYSYVYVLSPSPRVPSISYYAQKLIFEYCIRYASLMQKLIADPNYTAPLTFYDAMRVYMTGRQFLDVLQHAPEGLLAGVVPPLPDVKPTTAPPPSMPSVSIPHHESLSRFNTVRSITCIKQITDCLSRFGIRWGYMSWNQRYQNETAGMLEQLNLRVRELDEQASGIRRQSLWQSGSMPGHPHAHQNSTGSIGSNKDVVSSYAASSTVGSPSANGSMYTASPPYHAPSLSGSQNYTLAPQGLAVSRPASMTTSSPPAAPFSSPPAMPPYDFNQSNTFSQHPGGHVRTPPSHTHPTQQFATWGGYSAPPAAGVPDTLDEENAVPPTLMGTGR